MAQRSVVIAFAVPGIPQPKGSPRPLTRRDGSFAGLTVKSNACDKWERAIARDAYYARRRGEPLDVPVEVNLVFYMPRPKAPRFPVPAVAPDLDKLIRAVLDALQVPQSEKSAWRQSERILRDDSLVVDIVARARYADKTPGVAIEVRPLAAVQLSIDSRADETRDRPTTS